MKLVTIAYLLCTAFYCRSQSTSIIMGARVAGMGNAASALNDEWGIFNNPAGLAGIKSASTFISYDARSLLPGANRQAAGVAFPAKFAAAGVGIFRFGDELYNEQLLSATLANNFGLASLGIRFSYIQYNGQGFNTHNAFSISFGGIAEITPQVAIGAYIQNINQPAISESEQLPTKLAAGIRFRLSEEFITVTEIEKDIVYNAVYRMGAEYTIYKKIFARTGFNLNPPALFLGAGFRSKSFTIDYALSQNRAVGQSHQASLKYQFGKATER